MNNVKDKISFLKNKKVLITGNTGFKGSSYLCSIKCNSKNIRYLTKRKCCENTMFKKVRGFA